MLTDTHAHLYYPEIISDLDEILLRARDVGIERIIVPAVDLETSRTIIELSEKHGMIFCALGVHPCDVNKNELKVIDEIEKLLKNEKVLAIGEIGLDYYWDKSNIDRQKSFFRLQIELAKSYNLPVVIHTRNSTEDAIEIVRENYSENLHGQFHCFSGNESQLNQILDLDRFNNFYVSYCGNITYKNFTVTDVIKKTPLNKILSETDSPFLPPVPFRGKKNEPSFMVNTLMKVSELKEISYGDLIKSINENVNALFFERFI